MRNWWVMACTLMVTLGICQAQPPLGNSLSKYGLKVMQPLSPNEIMTMRAIVDAELRKGHFTPLFGDVTDEKGGKARHWPSGLICQLGTEGKRVVYASYNSAACETRGDDTVYTTTITRAATGTTLEGIADAAKASVEKEPGYMPVTANFPVAGPALGNTLPEHRTLHFVSRINGQIRAVSVRVGLFQGWILTERGVFPTEPTPAHRMSDLLREATFGTALATPRDVPEHP